MIDRLVIALYNEHRDELLEQIKQGIGLSKRENYVGIKNIGATCHLNSLLQQLYHINDFRRLIFKAFIDKPSSIILKELSFIFALLDKSITSSISAKDLTTAFGWNRSTTGSQQCSFELLNVLIEALQQTSKFLDEGLQELFKIQTSQILHCPDCNFSSSKIEDFYYITLDPPKSNKEMRTMNDIIIDSFKKEMVDWKCSNCNANVQASKYSEIKSLPRTLILHLNRLNFDYNTMRRQKLTYPISFPSELKATVFYNSNNDDEIKAKLDDTYEFSSCVIHTGSANGGHYKCLARSNNNKFLDCNDELVTELTDEEMTLLFNPVQDVVSKKHSLIHENGFLFAYTLKDTNIGDTTTTIPEDVQLKVDEFNNKLVILQKLYTDVHQGMLSINVLLEGFKNFANIEALSTLAIDIHNESTLDELLEFILQLISNNASIDDNEKQLIETLLLVRFEQVRVCKVAYNSTRSRITETFGGKETMSLKDLGIVTNSFLMLEHRDKDDNPFQEIRPGDMTLRLMLWDKEKYETESLDSLYNQTIVLKAEKDPSLLQLKNEIIKTFTFDEEKYKAAIIYHTDRDTLLLNDDNKCLRRDFKICLIDDIVVDIISKVVNNNTDNFSNNNNANTNTNPYYKETNEEESEALKLLWSERNNIKLLFKDPSSSQSDSNYSVSVSLTSTLLELKSEIGTLLNIKANDFYICRNSAGTLSLKENSKTLQEYGLMDQTFIFIKKGSGCAKGEIMMQFDYIDDTNEVDLFSDSLPSSSKKTISLGEHPILERIKVVDLKKTIFKLLSSSSIKGISNVPVTHNHIRLRDVRKPNEFLRNDRILNRVMLGLADGRKVICECLKDAEVIDVSDIIINVRLLSQRLDRLSRTVPIIISKTCQYLEFHNLLYEKFRKYGDSGSGGAYHFAKGYLSGPPLTTKTAAKLTWNGRDAIATSSSTIDGLPLSLRDGKDNIITHILKY